MIFQLICMVFLKQFNAAQEYECVKTSISVCFCVCFSMVFSNGIFFFNIYCYSKPVSGKWPKRNFHVLTTSISISISTLEIKIKIDIDIDTLVDLVEQSRSFKTLISVLLLQLTFQK